MAPGSRVEHLIWAFTPDQADSMIRLFVWNDQLRASDSILRSQLDSSKQAFHQFRISQAAQQEQITIATARLLERDRLITAQGIENKEQKKQIRKLKTGKTILGISTGIFGVAAAVLLILL